MRKGDAWVPLDSASAGRLIALSPGDGDDLLARLDLFVPDPTQEVRALLGGAIFRG